MQMEKLALLRCWELVGVVAIACCNEVKRFQEIVS